jgi:ParB family chromosome partitioning protein
MADTPAVDALLSTYQSILVDQIKPSSHQARKQFDEMATKSLADSIASEGLQNPVTVRRVEGGFELVSGERRLRAVKLLGQSTIDAHIIDVPSEGSAAAKGLLENLQRIDLNAIEEAEGFRDLLNLRDNHWNQERIAAITGKKPDYISRSLALLEMPEEVVEKLRQRNLTREHGIELLRIDNANSQKGMANKIVKGGWSVKKTREAIDKKQGKSAAPSSPSGSSTSSSLADPLAAVWANAQGNPQFTVGGFWEVHYDRKKNALGAIVGGWTLHVCPSVKEAPAALAVWLKKTADAVAKAVNPEAIQGIEKQLADYEKLNQDIAENAEDRRSKTEKEAPNIEANLSGLRSSVSDILKLRLPQTDQEMAELEALAAGSPSPQPVYSWIYGADNPMTKRMAGHTWAEMGIPDPKEGLKRLLGGVKKMKEQGL